MTVTMTMTMIMIMTSMGCQTKVIHQNILRTNIKRQTPLPRTHDAHTTP